jgi:hypothetical protein
MDMDDTMESFGYSMSEEDALDGIQFTSVSSISYKNDEEKEEEKKRKKKEAKKVKKKTKFDDSGSYNDDDDDDDDDDDNDDEEEDVPSRSHDWRSRRRNVSVFTDVDQRAPNPYHQDLLRALNFTDVIQKALDIDYRYGSPIVPLCLHLEHYDFCAFFVFTYLTPFF